MRAPIFHSNWNVFCFHLCKMLTKISFSVYENESFFQEGPGPVNSSTHVSNPPREWQQLDPTSSFEFWEMTTYLSFCCWVAWTPPICCAGNWSCGTTITNVTKSHVTHWHFCCYYLISKPRPVLGFSSKSQGSFFSKNLKMSSWGDFFSSGPQLLY